jgi:hypothetical protein
VDRTNDTPKTGARRSGEDGTMKTKSKKPLAAVESPRLVQYDDRVIKVDAGNGDSWEGTRFTCPQAKNTFFAFGCAPYGGRKITDGPIHPEPFPFIYPCATVIDSSGKNMEAHRGLTLNVGDTVYVKHYGFYVIHLDRDGYNLSLTR